MIKLPKVCYGGDSSGTDGVSSLGGMGAAERAAGTAAGYGEAPSSSEMGEFMGDSSDSENSGLSTGGFKQAERAAGLSTVDDVYGGDFKGDTGAKVGSIDLGAIAGGIAGFLAGGVATTKVGYELGKQADWNYEYAYDPDAADQYAQDTLSSFEGDRGGEEFKTLETNIRTAKETAAKVPTEPTGPTEAELEEQKRTDRATRLSRGRGGLLWQGDESGVNYSQKLGG